MFNDLSTASSDGLMSPPQPAELQQARAASLAAADTGLWERADASNPDPSRFVPTQLTGFDALRERRVQQLQAAADIAKTLRGAQEQVSKLDTERQVAIDLRLRHYRERQQLLSHRVLRLVGAIEAQRAARAHGGNEPALSLDEQAWLSKLRGVAEQMGRPESGLRRAYELSARLERSLAADVAPAAAHGSGMPPASNLNLENLDGWLARQQEGLAKLIEIAKDDLKDVTITVTEAQRRV